MAATAQTPAVTQHDAEEYQQQIDNIFSLKRPRDIKAGLASGGKSALKGIAAGTVGLFAAPVVGAYTDGLKGFGQGVAAGALRYFGLIVHTSPSLALCVNNAESKDAAWPLCRATFSAESSCSSRTTVELVYLPRLLNQALIICQSQMQAPISGVAGAVLLPVAGLGIGVAQVIRGAANTPEAVRESRQGRYWDQVCVCSNKSPSRHCNACIAVACKQINIGEHACS